MSTDDRDDRPEFPMRDGAEPSNAQSADRPRDLPDMPVWRDAGPDAEPAAAAEVPTDREAPAASSAPPGTPAADTEDAPVRVPGALDEPIVGAAAAAAPPVEPEALPSTTDHAESGDRDHAAAHADAGEPTTRSPIGGPYVVDGHGAPIAEQAKDAYRPRPQGGPYVTSSEPVADEAGVVAAASAPVVEPTPRTPYPAAAFAPAAPTAPLEADAYPADAYPSPLPIAAAPEAPRPRGNRGVGTLISLLGTLAFAVVYAGVSFLIISGTVSAEQYLSAFLTFLSSAAFLAPVVMFAVAMILTVLIVNRAGWWAYVLGGFLVAVVVYFGSIAGAVGYAYLTGVATGWGAQDQYDFVAALTLNPLTIAAAVVAREASIWTGAWIAARGRKLKARNAAARDEYARALEEHERAVADAARGRSALGDQTGPAVTW